MLTFDFICFDEVLVEIKALAALGPIEQAQAINYLRAANLHRALLINFGTTSLQHKRLVWSLLDDPAKLQNRAAPVSDRRNDDQAGGGNKPPGIG